MAKQLRRTITITIIETWILRWDDPDKPQECGLQSACGPLTDCVAGDGVTQAASNEPTPPQVDVIQFVRRSSSQTTVPITAEQTRRLSLCKLSENST